jgi:hypothetical protein
LCASLSVKHNEHTVLCNGERGWHANVFAGGPALANIGSSLVLLRDSFWFAALRLLDSQAQRRKAGRTGTDMEEPIADRFVPSVRLHFMGRYLFLQSRMQDLLLTPEDMSVNWSGDAGCLGYYRLLRDDAGNVYAIRHIQGAVAAVPPEQIANFHDVSICDNWDQKKAHIVTAQGLTVPLAGFFAHRGKLPSMSSIVARHRRALMPRISAQLTSFDAEEYGAAVQAAMSKTSNRSAASSKRPWKRANTTHIAAVPKTHPRTPSFPGFTRWRNEEADARGSPPEEGQEPGRCALYNAFSESYR